MKASVVIRTKNEERYLKSVLEMIGKQHHPDHEVILVDSGSTDGTLQIGHELGAKVVKIAPESFTYGKALNVGAENASGDVLVFLSGHAVPFDRDWLGNLIAPFADDEVAATTGKNIPHLDCNPFDARGLKKRFSTQTELIPTESGVNYANSCGAVRYSAWERYRFDEDLPYSEDIEWQRRLMGEGGKLVYTPYAVVRHSHNESPKQTGRRMYNQSSARKQIGRAEAVNGPLQLLGDLVFGTVYDCFAAANSNRPFRWMLQAPRRRFRLNAGRYMGSRGMEWSNHPVVAIVRRMIVRSVMVANGVSSRLVPLVMKWTKKSSIGLHPKHLYSSGEHHWYLENIQPGQAVLDLGCNRGSHALSAARKVGASGRILGLDGQAGMVNDAQSQARDLEIPNAEFVVADLEKPVPVEDASFDVVLALDVIEHLDNREQFLAQIHRLLKNDGELLLSAPNADTSWKKLRRRLGLFSLADPDHRIEYSEAELRRSMENAGFIVKEFLPVVYDTPWYGVGDLLGAFSPAFYRWWAGRKRTIALEKPEESTGWRMVLEKTR